MARLRDDSEDDCGDEEDETDFAFGASQQLPQHVQSPPQQEPEPDADPQEDFLGAEEDVEGHSRERGGGIESFAEKLAVCPVAAMSGNSVGSGGKENSVTLLERVETLDSWMILGILDIDN